MHVSCRGLGVHNVPFCRRRKTTLTTFFFSFFIPFALHKQTNQKQARSLARPPSLPPSLGFQPSTCHDLIISRLVVLLMLATTIFQHTPCMQHNLMVLIRRTAREMVHCGRKPTHPKERGNHFEG